MTGTCSRVGRGACALLVAGTLAGCEELKPHRTEWDAPKGGLPPAACGIVAGIGQVAEQCGNRIWEHNTEYDMLFTEFTDQGLVYPDQRNEGRGAGYQINHTMDALKTIIGMRGTEGISLVVFVHGWHHNAGSGDDNVEAFRRLLRTAADIERVEKTGYRVVGVYVGWRGESVRPFPLNYATFWGRKAAATRVAQGSPRELFNRLRNFRCSHNEPKDGAGGGANGSGDCPLPADVARRRPKVSTVLVGHSFGAWILYNALAGSLAESLQQVKDREPGGEGAGGVNLRYADMVVLLNPAFEASRYTPLHRISTARPWLSRYQPPMLVSVTSSADWATRSAFPIGRFVNSIVEDSANEEERYATKYTMGHMTGARANYITHELTSGGGEDGLCKDWRHLGRVDRDPPGPFQEQQRVNIRAEVANSRAFIGNKPKLADGWQRPFCGGVRLTHKQNDPNSAIWNIRADGTIMADHSDITNPNLIDFMRQMYQEAVLHTWWTEPDTAPPARPVAR